MTARVGLRRSTATLAVVGMLGLFTLASSGSAGAATLFEVTATIPDSGGPVAVAVDPTTHNVYTANSITGTVSVIAGSGDTEGTVEATVPIGVETDGVAVDPSTHNLYVVNTDLTVDGQSLWVVDESGDARNGSVTASVGLEYARPEGIAVDSSTHDLYVANGYGRVVVIDESGDARTGMLTDFIPIASDGPSAVAVDPSTHNVYATGLSLAVIDESGDAGTGSVTASIVTDGGESAVAVDPSTHNVYVTNTDEFRDGWVSVVDESGDAHTGTVVATIPVGVNPSGVAVDPSTHDVYVANKDSNTVSVIDESGDAHTGTVVATIPVGVNPSGVAVDPSTHDVYVANKDSNTVSVISPIVAGSIAGEVTDATSGSGIAGACVEVVTAATGHRVTVLYANSRGDYSGAVPIGSDKLIASDCVGNTHATTYYGGADDYDFLGPDATAVDVTATTNLTGINVALPLAGTISGSLTDSASGLPVSGICAYAIDIATSQMRAYSVPSNASGNYTIGGLPPGSDRVALEPCTTGPYPLTYSRSVTVIAGRTVTVNQALTKS